MPARIVPDWRWRQLPWLGIVGAILIFLSWVFQNKLANDATAERLRLERAQLAIDLQQMRMNLWEIAYLQEKSKDRPNNDVLLAAAFKALQSRLNLFAWSFAAIRDDEASISRDITEKNFIQENLIERFKQRNLQQLENDLSESAKIEDKHRLASTLHTKFTKKYEEIAAKEDKYTLMFILTYIIGSVMVAIDFSLKLAQRSDQGAGR